MSVEIKIPAVGESITQVQISEWLKSEGDDLKQDETVAIVDSEKTTFELPAPRAGRLAKILRRAGETVKVGEVVGQIEANGNGETPRAAPQKTEAKKPTRPAVASREEEKSKAKPEPCQKEAVQEKITPNPTKPSPEEEKQTEILPPAAAESEVTKEPEPPPASGPREEEVVPMSMLRQTVARRLVEAQQTMAMLTTFNEVDMSAAQNLRKEHGPAFEKRHGVKLGLMSFFVKAAIEALKLYPQLNAEIRERDIVYHNYFDIGVAIGTERGLVVPVLRDAAQLSFAAIEKAIGDFAARAKAGRLKPDELTGGTFTITNGGVFGSLLSTPIINPPQTGILGMHTIQERPVAVAGQVVIRPMMYLALTYDHRLVDGREAVLFLRQIKELIESPARILLEV